VSALCVSIDSDFTVFFCFLSSDILCTIDIIICASCGAQVGRRIEWKMNSRADTHGVVCGLQRLATCEHRQVPAPQRSLHHYSHRAPRPLPCVLLSSPLSGRTRIHPLHTLRLETSFSASREHTRKKDLCSWLQDAIASGSELISYTRHGLGPYV
jgi:hypothetical protein